MTSKDAERTFPSNNCPPVVSATEGASIAVRANAPINYTVTGTAGKANFVMPEKAAGRPDSLPAIAPPHHSKRIAYRAPDGRIWAYVGKKGRVLYMLATRCQGLTQWDTYPWHTRLAATVHAMKADGLNIDRVIEGDNRHARYFLRTPGTLLDKGGAQ